MLKSWCYFVMVTLIVSSIDIQALSSSSMNAEETKSEYKRIEINPKDGAEMIFVSAGDFLMGSTDADKDANDNEKPQRKVYLDAYYIYKTEVTVAQYRKFCKATFRKMPKSPRWGWKEDHPIVNVNWHDANAYADWAGVRLPTEAQWEKAARGTDGRINPWGNEWDKKKCVNSLNSGVKTSPTASKPDGASPYGCHDMAGNVWEWCADWYDNDYYKKAPVKNPVGPDKGDFRVLRGGSWGNRSGNCRSTYRSYNNPDNFSYGYFFGFRCASPIRPKIGWVTVNSTPTGALINIDGKSTGKVTPTKIDIIFYENEPQTREVNVTTMLQGYQTTAMNVSVTVGKESTCTLIMNPLPVMKAGINIGNQCVNPIDGAEMIFVPAGYFLMGSTDADEDANNNEKPQLNVYLDAYDFSSRGYVSSHDPRRWKVYLDSYYIYKTEVTVAQYRKFCKATGRKMPTETSRKWQDTHPIVNVTWDDAKAYADWAGVLLPTEAQWEKVAWGTDGNIYPWSNKWDETKCVNGSNSNGKTSPKGSDGASLYGCLDMAGNVWEWSAEWYCYDHYKNAAKKNPTRHYEGSDRVLRKGSWYSYFDYYIYIDAYRHCYNPRYGIPYGFRCVSPIRPKIGWVTVNSTPTGALINIDGKSTGKLTPAKIDIIFCENEPQTREVNVTTMLQGYQTTAMNVSVTIGKESTCTLTMNPLPVMKAGTNIGNQCVNLKDGAEMVLVPAGDFLMGSTDADEDAWDCEKPQRKVYLDAYYMYKYEVSVSQYRKFCKATDRKMPKAPGWGWEEDHPIVNVSWHDANAYAEWAGVVLPTEAQWEKAARGTDGRKFPWGNRWYNEKYVNNVNGGSKTSKIGSKPDGASPYGCQDMAGNVYEWCTDWYDDEYYKKSSVKNPTGPDEGEFRVLRGGSWFYYGYYYRSAFRNSRGGFSYDNIGFRCVNPIRKIGYLMVNSAPSGALINIDGKSTGKITPAKIDMIFFESEPQTREVSVSTILRDYQTTHMKVSVNPEKESTCILTLNPLPVMKAGTNVGNQCVNPTDGAEMILVPAGDFLMGSSDADKDARDNEKPQRKVYLDSYYIYKYEVTVAQYRKFCEATDRKMSTEPNWGWKEDHPIVNISWHDAKAYADWAGVLLPTEAQWEKAARGTDGRIYPWGNRWYYAKCVNNSNSGDKTSPTGSKPNGASPYGCQDMAGNAYEWCTDWYSKDYYKNAPKKNPTGPVEGEFRVIRGGSWYYYGCDIFFRGACRYYNDPDGGDYYIGFRCASPVQ